MPEFVGNGKALPLAALLAVYNDHGNDILVCPAYASRQPGDIIRKVYRQHFDSVLLQKPYEVRDRVQSKIPGVVHKMRGPIGFP